jgi:uncharacterized membrane protein YcaP (DUF421 family)
MIWGFSIDWKTAFVPTIHLAEIFLRGSLIYLALFFALRFLRRQAGGLSIADLLVVVLVADAAQNAMASEYKSITEGLLLVATIMFWDFVIDWFGHRFPRWEWLIRPGPLPLVKDGRVLWRNMRREMVTEEELMSQVRQQGAKDITQVKEAYLEGDGRISVIVNEAGAGNGQTPRKLLT